MLDKKYRLKKRSAFTATYKTGTTLHIGGITIFCGKNKKNDTPTKIGFVVSKKIHKRAVKRNHIKRLMREAVRLYIKNKGELNTPYMSLVIVSSTHLLEKNFYEIKNNIDKLMDKIVND